MKKTIKTIVNIVLWVFVILAFILTVMVFTSSGSGNGVNHILGYSVFTIQTSSMEPTIPKGSAVIAQSTGSWTASDYSTLKNGDIITFWSDLDGDGNNELNTHRIESIVYTENDATVPYSIITKGDNNPTEDQDLVYTSEIVGVYQRHIAGLGNVIDFLQSQVGFFFCIILPLFLFFIYELYSFISALIEMKGGKKQQLSESEEEAIKQKAIEEYLASQKTIDAEAGATLTPNEDEQTPEE